MGSVRIILQVRTYVKNTHSYNTRTSFHDHLAVPKCRSNTGLPTFHASATYLWNCLDDKFKTITHERNFKKLLVNNFLQSNSHCEHFTISRTFWKCLVIYSNTFYVHAVLYLNFFIILTFFLLNIFFHIAHNVNYWVTSNCVSYLSVLFIYLFIYSQMSPNRSQTLSE